MLSTSIRRILIASGFTVATSFMTVLSASANTVTSNTGFTGAVAPSVAIVTDFTGKTVAKTYTPTTYAPSGGVSQLQATDTISFNSNSDTLGVTATIVATPPTAPTNATALVGVHSTLINSNVGTENITATATAQNFITDTQGNLTLAVRSTWLPQAGGQELFNSGSGTYAATVGLSVVAN